MEPGEHLDWPFLEPRHRALGAAIGRWAGSEARAALRPGDTDASCRALVAALGAGGWLGHAVAAGEGGRLDVRAVCVAREQLAAELALADFAFAMQGLGSTPIALAGSPGLRAAYLPASAAGEAIAAFALSEPGAGSDVAAIATRARREGPGYVLEGTKTWVSNGGIADYYVLFARTGEAPGSRGLSAFVIDAGTPGLSIAERIEVSAPHPLARLELDGCRVAEERLLGTPGRGLALALATLERFRPTVGAAALGLARRALAEALGHARERPIYGGRLADLAVTRAALAEMALRIDAAAALVYRAAWRRDTSAARIDREAAMAKLYATEAAQEVIDAALQLHGARGVVAGSVMETLYREVRALRIYEGTSEVQREVIARALLAGEAGNGGQRS